MSRLLDEQGLSYAEEAGIALNASPEPLFQLLVLATLLSARIRSGAAIQAMRGLLEAGLGDPGSMAKAGWESRVRVLNEHGYARYDESTSRMLGDTCERLLRQYGGDLNRLREAAGREVEKERELLQEFKGIGPVGASIFLREVQGEWEEVYPFVDERVAEAAEGLGLPGTAEGLSGYADRKSMARLLAAILRAERKKKRGGPKRAKAQRATQSGE